MTLLLQMYNWQPFDATATENNNKHLSYKCKLHVGRAGNGNMSPPVSDLLFAAIVYVTGK